MFDIPLALLKLVLQIHIEQKLFVFYNLQLNLLSYFICIRINLNQFFKHVTSYSSSFPDEIAILVPDRAQLRLV